MWKSRSGTPENWTYSGTQGLVKGYENVTLRDAIKFDFQVANTKNLTAKTLQEAIKNGFGNPQIKFDAIQGLFDFITTGTSTYRWPGVSGNDAEVETLQRILAVLDPTFLNTLNRSGNVNPYDGKYGYSTREAVRKLARHMIAGGPEAYDVIHRVVSVDRYG